MGRGNTAAASATGLNVVNVAESTGLNDLLDLLHVSVHSGLEADRKDLAACLFSLHNLNSLVESYRKGFFEQNVKSVLERVNSGLCVLTVIGADGNCIKLQGLVVDKLLVRSVIGLCSLDSVLFHKCRCLTGNKVCSCNYFNVRLIEKRLCVRIRNPTAADDSYANLL